VGFDACVELMVASEDLGGSAQVICPVPLRVRDVVEGERVFAGEALRGNGNGSGGNVV
jgi:hypothetical protein